MEEDTGMLSLGPGAVNKVSRGMSLPGVTDKFTASKNTNINNYHYISAVFTFQPEGQQ